MQIDQKKSTSLPQQGRSSAFIYLEKKPIEELDAHLIVAQHQATGAKVLLIQNEDPERLFSISIPTYPDNDRGTPHILEHTALCGCGKYPVKDPFFYMTRRSMNTFMNAFTGNDFTCYPAASMVKEDFHHLFDIYFESVFDPLLSHESFLQEGFRLTLNGAKKSLARAGIVYNEMKGAYQNPTGLLWRTLSKHLYQGGTYSFDAGGDPRAITEITHEELTAFHRRFYQPSKALFYFYGHMEMQEVEELLEPRLRRFSGLDQEVSTPRKELEAKESMLLEGSVSYPPKDLSAPRGKRAMHEAFYAASGQKEASVLLSAAWQVARIEETGKLLRLALLDQLLMGHDGGSLKKRLLQSTLIDNCDSHLDLEMLQAPFVFTLFSSPVEIEELAKEEKKEELLEGVRALLNQSLLEVVHEGFSAHEIAAAMHQLRLSFLDISGGSFPFGLTLFFRAALPYQHGIEPTKMLQMQQQLQELEAWAQDPKVLTTLIQEELLNTPALWTALLPDPNLNEKQQAIEEKEIAAQESTLSGKQKEQIEQDEEKLKAWQEKDDAQAVASLPLLPLEAIDPEPPKIDLEATTEESQKLKHYTHHCFTNSFCYGQLAIDTRINLAKKLSQEQLNQESINHFLYGRLCSLWGELGYGDKSFEETSIELESCCQELDAQHQLHATKDGNLLGATRLVVSGLERKQQDFTQALEQHLLHKRFDEGERLEQLRDQQSQEMMTHLADLGFSFARSASARTLSQGAFLLDVLEGLPTLAWTLMQQEPSALATWQSALKPLYHELLGSLTSKELAWVATKQRARDLKQQRATPHHDPKTPPSPSLTGQECSRAIESALEILQEKLALPAKKLEHQEALHAVKASLNSFLNQYRRWPKSHGFEIPSEVAFNAMSLPAPYRYEEPKAAHAALAAALMGHLYLHPAIREKGGAYGSGCRFDRARSTMTFHSYRDPHILQTFKHFEEATAALSQGKFDPMALHEAKLKVLQQLSAPIPPSNRGSSALLWKQLGLTQALRARHRSAVLKATKEEVVEIGKELEKRLAQEEGCYVSYAGATLLQKAHQEWSKEQPFPIYELEEVKKACSTRAEAKR